MKMTLLILAALALAGCASPSGNTSVARETDAGGQGLTAQIASLPRYEYQLDVDYSDGATAFLHLAEVRDP